MGRTSVSALLLALSTSLVSATPAAKLLEREVSPLEARQDWNVVGGGDVVVYQQLQRTIYTCPCDGSRTTATAGPYGVVNGPLTATTVTTTATVCLYQGYCYAQPTVITNYVPVNPATVNGGYNWNVVYNPTVSPILTGTSSNGAIVSPTLASTTSYGNTTFKGTPLPPTSANPTITSATGSGTAIGTVLPPTTGASTTAGQSSVNGGLTSTTSGGAATTTASGPAAGTTTTFDVTGLTYINAMLQAHNIHRANHSSPALVWDATLATYAQQLAETCVYQHSKAQGDGNYGQNIGAGAAGNAAAGLIGNLMYNGEINNYPQPYGVDRPDLTNFASWGHYSQIVWRNTQRVGCYTNYCPQGLTNAGTGVQPYFTVCDYFPSGNFGGQFSNVPAPQGQGTVVIVGS